MKERPRGAVDSSAVGRPSVPDEGRTPVRTCVGCRIRGARTELLRVVAVGGVLVPDPRARLAGRGAWLHPVADCLDLAVRRRALPRALRVPGPLDDSAVRDEIGRRTPPAPPHDSTTSTAAPS